MPLSAGLSLAASAPPTCRPAATRPQCARGTAPCTARGTRQSCRRCGVRRGLAASVVCGRYQCIGGRAAALAPADGGRDVPLAQAPGPACADRPAAPRALQPHAPRRQQCVAGEIDAVARQPRRDLRPAGLLALWGLGSDARAGCATGRGHDGRRTAGHVALHRRQPSALRPTPSQAPTPRPPMSLLARSSFFSHSAASASSDALRACRGPRRCVEGWEWGGG